jgi:hypothetical protein
MKKRMWMKDLDKEQVRRKLLSNAMDRFRSEREKNVSKLRSGFRDVNELAREMLTSSMCANSLMYSPESVAFIGEGELSNLGTSSSGHDTFHGSHNPEADRNCGCIIEDSYTETSSYTQKSILGGTMSSTHEDDDEEAALIRFLGTEEHQLLMEQVADAINWEIEEGLLLDYESSTLHMADIDSYLIEEVTEDDRFIICPLCR